MADGDGYNYPRVEDFESFQLGSMKYRFESFKDDFELLKRDYAKADFGLYLKSDKLNAIASEKHTLPFSDAIGVAESNIERICHKLNEVG